MNLDLQKASMWKRISAALFDVITHSILVVAFAYVLSGLLGYDSYNVTFNNAMEHYAAQFGTTFQMTAEQIAVLTEAEIANYEAAYQALTTDTEAMYAYNMIIYMSLGIASISVFLSFLVLEFLVPLQLGDGQTIGKRIFSIGVIRTDFVRVPAVQLFIRSILGKYTIGTMLPILILILLFFGQIGLIGTAILIILVFGQIAAIAITGTNSALHDLLAGTVTVDISSQRIFKDSQSLLDYQKKMYAEKAEKQNY